MKKRIIATEMTTTVICSSLVISNANTKLNDIKGHWAESTINTFVNKGFISGYSDATFKPNNSITRAEFVKILNKYFGLNKKSGQTFEDTKTHWAKDEIDIAITNGITKGLYITKFEPNKSITREEVSVMVSNYLNLFDTNYEEIAKFNDKNSISDFAKSAIEGMIERNYIGGYEDNTTRPKGNITRAEAISILNRINVNNIPQVENTPVPQVPNKPNKPSTPNVTPNPEVPIVPEDNSRIVYVNGGSSSSNIYHKTIDAHKMKDGVKMTESEARAKGYVPCKRCY